MYPRSIAICAKVDHMIVETRGLTVPIAVETISVSSENYLAT